jgi:multicomponent Na+:H+ antiporter subunit F
VSTFLVACLLTITLLIAVGLYRVWAGPTVFDRLVAVALVSVNGVVVLVLLGITLERPDLFFDIALGFALLAFLLPIALGRYFDEQGEIPVRPLTGERSGASTPTNTEPDALDAAAPPSGASTPTNTEPDAADTPAPPSGASAPTNTPPDAAEAPAQDERKGPS